MTRHDAKYYLRVADHILSGKRHEMYDAKGQRMKINPDKFTRVPQVELKREPDKEGFYRLLKDRWWALDTDDNVLFYGRIGMSPQCNSNKEIIKLMVEMEGHPAVAMIFLERVWLPHNCTDYIMWGRDYVS